MKVVDPRTFFSLTAIADRIAKRDGLHQNSQPRGMSAFDAEMRRRVWWQIVLLDTRAAEVSGAGTSTLGCGWNTKFPLNVSESELTPEAEVLPQGHEHATDMIFCLVRCEIAEFLRQIRAKANIEGRWSEFSNPCVSLLDKLAAIDAFEKHLQTTYLVHCDHRTTVHALARHYAIQSIAKMKIVAYGALSPRSRQDHPSVSDERHDRLMQVCIEAIEAYHQCVANRSLMRFAWFLAGNVPFLAYVHLLSDLRNRPKGDLVERAWEVVTSRNDVFGRPESLKGFGRRLLEAKDGTLQTAFAELVVRAWDARQAALGSESHIPVPPMVRKMRETLAATKGWSAEDAPIKTWVTQEKSDVKSVSVPTNGSIGNCPRSTSMYPNIIRLSKSGSSPRVEDPIPHTLNSTNMADMPSDRLPMHDELYELDYWQTLLPPESVEYAMDWDQALFSMYG